MDAAVKNFEAFAACFATSKGLHPMLKLKREHTLKVLDNAAHIVASLQGDADILDPQESRLPLLGALFHDVGRFPQYQRYGTFRDADSTNHGILGSQTLATHPEGQQMLQGLTGNERRLVRGMVALHNKRFLPSHIPEKLRNMTRIVRDADKLDIMRVMIEHFEACASDPGVTLHVKEHPTEYTQQVYDDVLHARRGDYRSLRWTNDFKLMLLGWVHDLNFPGSRRLLHERGVLDRLFDMLPDIPAMDALEELLRERIQRDLTLE